MIDNNYKMIFIDIDGTLVNDEKIISEENISVITKLKEIGIYTVLASGKPYKSIEMFSEKCNAVPYLIGSNGAIVKDFKKDIDIFTKQISYSIANEIHKIIKTNNIYTMVTVDGNLIVEEEKYGMITKNRPEICEVPSIFGYLKSTEKSILKFTIIDGDKEKIANVRESLFKIPNISITPVDIIGIPQRFRKEGEEYSDPYCIDVMAKGINKADAITTLLKYLNISRTQTIAIGDGMNDIEMFESCYYKIAMGNAVQEIKDLANIITLSNNDSGVSVALNKLFTKELSKFKN